jgi:hypothetical protein
LLALELLGGGIPEDDIIDRGIDMGGDGSGSYPQLLSVATRGISKTQLVLLLATMSMTIITTGFEMTTALDLNGNDSKNESAASQEASARH